MIGQYFLLSRLKYLTDTYQFPRSVIIEGPRGSGRVTIAKEVAKAMNVSYIIVEPKIADIRDMITLAYQTPEILLFIVKEADKLSTQARGAMLKLTEEPPNMAYIIMCAEDSGRVSEALRSRSQIFRTDTYSSEEILEYAKTVCTQSELSADVVGIPIDVCTTPGDVDELIVAKPLKMYSFVQNVYDHIASSSLENVMKLSKFIKIKADGEGYPLELFLKMFMSIAYKDNFKYMMITNECLGMLSNPSVAKQGIFDTWLVKIRESAR